MLPENSILVLARKTYTYNPPKPRKEVPKSRTTSVGSRGCNKPSLRRAKVQLLAPEDHVGLTTFGHPVFFGRVTTTSPVKVSFVLAEPGVVEPIAEMEQTVQSSGIIKFSLPSQQTGIKQGKPYLWTVSLICNSKRPSQNAYAYAWIERVPTPASLTSQLKASQISDRSAIYAQSGIWYDALAEAYRDNSSLQQFSRLLIQLSQVNKTDKT